jgi:hypothetical protein
VINLIGFAPAAALQLTFLLAEGGALLFRPPTAKAKFITKSSLLLLKLNI